MDKQLTLDGATARNLYPGAAPEFKTLLEKNFGADYFKQSLKDRIKTWPDAAAEYGKDPVRWLPYPQPQDSDEVSCNAYFKLTKIIRLFKNGVKSEYDTGTQAKYWAWFKKNRAGFGFDSTGTYFDGSDTAVGPRLSSHDRATCEYIAKQFESIFNDFYTE